MVQQPKAHVDVAIVGGGIAGASLATILARAGLRVVVLERQSVYEDRVRGELLQPWGVLEAQRLGLATALEQAGGVILRWAVQYDEVRTPAEALAERRDVRQVLPGVDGPLCVGHAEACEALTQVAQAAGARILRGVSNIQVTPGNMPEIGFAHNGGDHQWSCRLVIGADGRTSTVRAQARIRLHRASPTHVIGGMLVDGVPEWPQCMYGAGTEGDVMFFVIPRGGQRLRLYFCSALDQRRRFSGPGGPAAFLRKFRSLKALPFGEAIAGGTPTGPCVTLSGEDTWTETPLTDGVALIGDAAGYSDPILAQGLSLALRDVRVLSDLLLTHRDWSTTCLIPYAQERRERMRRVRFTAGLLAALQSEFGPEAAARRRRFVDRVREGHDPELRYALAPIRLGPDRVPAFAFEEAMRAKVLQ
jgi:2-polyprenyl-6-methoxyphenol hydroxylase-like FAD-dependent oxidoreductase